MSPNSSCRGPGRMTAPDRLCPPHVFAFSITATGTSPRRSIVSGSSPSSCSSLFAHASPAVPPPTIATPTSMSSSSASRPRLMNSFCGSTGGGNAAGATAPLRADIDQLPFFAFTASVSLGRILFRSPTIPRSENSKMGAFASLLIATMFSEDCIPTLCWIAPEIPAALADLECVQAADHDADRRAVFDLGDGRVTQDRALRDQLASLRAHSRHLHHHAGAEARRQPRADLEAEQSTAEHRVGVIAVADRLGHCVRDRLREPFGPLCDEHLAGAVLP